MLKSTRNAIRREMRRWFITLAEDQDNLALSPGELLAVLDSSSEELLDMFSEELRVLVGEVIDALVRQDLNG